MKMQSWDQLAHWKIDWDYWVWSDRAGSCGTHTAEHDTHVSASCQSLPSRQSSNISSDIQDSSPIPTFLRNLSWQLQPRTRCSSVGGGHRKDMILELNPGNQRLLTPFLSLDVHSTYHSHYGGCSKDTALRKRGILGTVWTKDATEPTLGLYVDFSDSSRWVQKSTF